MADKEIDTSNDGFLTKDQIVTKDDKVSEIVEVPEWGGKVRVKGLTGTERDAFESSMLKKKGKDQVMDTHNIRAKLCALTIVKADGTRMFDDSEVGILGQKSAAALDRVYTVAMRLSKISKEDIEELEGDLQTDRSGAGS